MNLIKVWNKSVILNRIIGYNNNYNIRRKKGSTSNVSEEEINDTYSQGKTHFGFQTINENEKNEKVHKVFEEVAKSYDLMNDVMSVGIHRIWKDIFIERLGPVHGMSLLDMAGGTGDIAFRFIKYLCNSPNTEQRTSNVTIADINEHMLSVGQERAKGLNHIVDQLPHIDIEWKQANAEELPFANNSFNAYTIAFGIRNCTRPQKVLEEAYRVLQPGGRFMCLEFSHLSNNTIKWLYDLYSFQVIPPMGQILLGQWEPYQYLVESIRRVPNQEKFKQMIRTAGFQGVTYENLTFGIVSIHSAFKLENT